MKIAFSPAISNNKNLYKNTNIKPISFRSESNEDGDIIETSHTEKIGWFKKITRKNFYNKKTGGMTQVTMDRKDNVTERKEFFPKKGMEIDSVFSEDGITTITKKTDTSEITEKLDSENRTIYYEIKTQDGIHKIEVTDYERGRRVVSASNNGEELPIVVIDLATQSPVTSGELVIDTRYDEETDTHITENIVTKAKYKEVKLDANGNPIYEKEFHPETGNIVIDREYNKEGASLFEDTYTGAEDNKLVRTLFVSEDGKTKNIVLFDEDGETITSHTSYTYRKDGTIEREIKYTPDNIKTEEIIYGKNGEKEVKTYNTETQKLSSTKKYNKKGGFIAETIFYPDGETPKAERRISPKGEISVSTYNEQGIETQRKHYNQNKELELIENFDPKTNTVLNTIEYDKATGRKTITEYDEEYEAPFKRAIFDKNGKPIVKTIFHPDGETPLYAREFYNDGSYVDTEFDVYGEPIKSTKYTKDGEKKY